MIPCLHDHKENVRFYKINSGVNELEYRFWLSPRKIRGIQKTKFVNPPSSPLITWRVLAAIFPPRNWITWLTPYFCNVKIIDSISNRNFRRRRLTNLVAHIPYKVKSLSLSCGGNWSLNRRQFSSPTCALKPCKIWNAKRLLVPRLHARC